jgi:hypothetical protein
MPAMEAEHCSYFGSHEEFEAEVSNVKVKTCPCKEWELVLKPRRELRSGRKQVDIQQLLSHGVSRRAGLKVFEIIAIVLYTGPMVYEYDVFLNCGFSLSTLILL